MSLVVVGLEPDRVPLDLLERVAIPEDELGKVLAHLSAAAEVTEVAVVSTCLRTEIYAVVDRFHDGVGSLQRYLAERAGLEVAQLADRMTVGFDEQVADHLFKVAAGLRSAVLGETEVLGQVRRAGDRAAEVHSAGPVLKELFRRAVQAGRRARSETGIARGSLSLSHVAAEQLAETLGGSLTGRLVLVMGAGEMGEGVTRALVGSGAEVVVANRTRARAEAVVAACGARAAVGLGGCRELLAEAAAVAVCTGGGVAVLEAAAVEAALAERAAGADPLVVVDLGMPRAVERSVGELAGVRLFDLDHLRARARATLGNRLAEVAAAEAVLSEELARYREEQRARGAAPVVGALRRKVDALLEESLARARRRHPELGPAEWAAVESVSRDLVARLLHQPSVALKESAGTARGERLVEAARALFGL